MWTFGLHGGSRIAMGGNSVLTPYLNYDYVNAKLKSFTETGRDGANLTVYGGQLEAQLPDRRRQVGDPDRRRGSGGQPWLPLPLRRQAARDFSAAFIGDTACDFDIISASQKRGTFLAGLSVGGKMGPVDLRIGYEGEFNSDITSHSGNFKIVLPLGWPRCTAAAAGSGHGSAAAAAPGESWLRRLPAAAAAAGRAW